MKDAFSNAAIHVGAIRSYGYSKSIPHIDWNHSETKLENLQTFNQTCFNIIFKGILRGR